MPMLKRLILVLFSVVLLASCDKADTPAAAVEIKQAFIKQIPPGQTRAAVYLNLINNSEKEQVINYVHSPVADHVEVHRHFHENGMMQMRPVNHVRVDAGKELIFSPGGYHLMLFGVYDELKLGEEFELTVEFESGTVVTVPVVVKGRG